MCRASPVGGRSIGHTRIMEVLERDPFSGVGERQISKYQYKYTRYGGNFRVRSLAHQRLHVSDGLAFKARRGDSSAIPQPNAERKPEKAHPAPAGMDCFRCSALVAIQSTASPPLRFTARGRSAHAEKIHIAGMLDGWAGRRCWWVCPARRTWQTPPRPHLVSAASRPNHQPCRPAGWRVSRQVNGLAIGRVLYVVAMRPRPAIPACRGRRGARTGIQKGVSLPIRLRDNWGRS